MKFKYLFICILMLIFSSCGKKKKNSQTNINAQDFLSTKTDLTALRNIEKMKINDSTYKVEGELNSLKISGYLTPNDEKINWWKIIDSNTDQQIAYIEYRLIGKKIFANQYKFFNNQKLDTLRSKYYSFNILNQDNTKNISYSFYVPKAENIINTSGQFTYVLYDLDQQKDEINSKCNCINEGNLFRCVIPIPKKTNILINGIFWEVTEVKNGTMGGSEIYIRDTINAKI